MLRIAAIWTMFWPTLAAAMHPISHVDAWLAVKERTVEARLIADLDDVLRSRNPPRDTDGKIPVERFRAAVTEHGEHLISRISIYDQEGNPLRGELLAAPALAEFDAAIDPEHDIGIRLTWKLRWSADLPLTALTFLPRLNHPDLIAPPELRLHVQPPGAGRRIDATVFDDCTHTVMFGAEASAPGTWATGAGMASELNATACTLLAGSRNVMAELTFPLHQWVRESSPGETEPEMSEVVSPERLQQIGASIRRELAKRCRVRDSRGSEFSAEEVAVRHFVTSDPSRLLTDIAPDKSLPAAVLSVRARLTYRLVDATDRTEFVWSDIPGRPDIVNLTRLSRDRNETQVAPVTDAALAVFVNLPAALEVSVLPPFDRTDAEQVIQVGAPRPTLSAAVTGAATAVCGMLLSMRLSRQPVRRAALGATLLASGVIILAGMRPVRTVRADAAQRVAGRLIETAIQSAAGPVSDAMADRLLDVMAPDLAETVFLGIRESLARVDGGDSGFVLDIRCTGFEAGFCEILTGSEEGVAVNARWSVSGDVFHWGHLHRQERHYEGTLRMARSGEHWRLEQVVLHSVRDRAETQPIAVSRGHGVPG